MVIGIQARPGSVNSKCFGTVEKSICGEMISSELLYRHVRVSLLAKVDLLHRIFQTATPTISVVSGRLVTGLHHCNKVINDVGHPLCTHLLHDPLQHIGDFWEDQWVELILIWTVELHPQMCNPFHCMPKACHSRVWGHNGVPGIYIHFYQHCAPPLLYNSCHYIIYWHISWARNIFADTIIHVISLRCR